MDQITVVPDNPLVPEVLNDEHFWRNWADNHALVPHEPSTDVFPSEDHKFLFWADYRRLNAETVGCSPTSGHAVDEAWGGGWGCTDQPPGFAGLDVPGTYPDAHIFGETQTLVAKHHQTTFAHPAFTLPTPYPAASHPTAKFSRYTAQHQVFMGNNSSQMAPDQAADSQSEDELEAPYNDGKRKARKTKSGRRKTEPAPTLTSLAEAEGSRALSANNTPTKSPKRKRKRKSGQSLTEQASTNPAGTDAEPISRKRRRAAVAPSSDNDNDNVTSRLEDEDEKGFYKLGAFSLEERNLIAELVEQYRVDEDLTVAEVNRVVQAPNSHGANAKFWNSLRERLPRRKGPSIMRYCRRAFHNFEKRGAWTPAEDKQLLKTYTHMPRRWARMSEVMERHPDDIRDRYRNYLVCGSNRKTDIWTEEEEHSLLAAVNECVLAVEEDRKKQKKKDPRLEFDEIDIHDINFQTVSEKMDKTRSRLQCANKWRHMQAREAARTAATPMSDPTPAEEANEQEQKQSWRVRSAESKYQKMKAGDKCDILREIMATDSYDERNIPWPLITKHPDTNKQWTTADRKVAFRRMKELVPPQENLEGTIDALWAYLNTNHADELDDHYVPPPPKRRRKRSKKTNATPQESLDGSAESDVDNAESTEGEVADSRDVDDNNADDNAADDTDADSEDPDSGADDNETENSDADSWGSKDSVI